jgi:hypothetical protein
LFTEFFSHLGQLVPDEFIVKFKILVILEYITKKHKHCGIIIYKLCVKTGYMCNMRLCLGTDFQTTTDKITVTTHSTMRHLTRRVGVGDVCGNTHMTAQLLPLFSPPPFLTILLPLVSDPCNKSDHNYFFAIQHSNVPPPLSPSLSNPSLCSQLQTKHQFPSRHLNQE